MSALSTYEPPSGSFECDDSQPKFYQPDCTPLAYCQPGGLFGSQTVSCGCASIANKRDQQVGITILGLLAYSTRPGPLGRRCSFC